MTASPHWCSAIYAAICADSAGLGSGAAWAAPVMAGLLMVLLLVSIRNAWDLVTWIAPMRTSGDPRVLRFQIHPSGPHRPEA